MKQWEEKDDIFPISLRKLNMNTVRIKKIIHCLDFTGAPCIPKKDYENSRNKFQSDIQILLDELVLINKNQCVLRGKKYYLDILHKQPDRIVDIVLKNTLRLEYIIRLIDYSQIKSEDIITILCLLDHKKHYSLILLNALYHHMVGHPDFPVNLFNRVEEVAKQDVDNYYSFLMTGQSPEIIHLNGLLNRLSGLEYPEDTERDSGTSKLVFREMDHPGQIVLFAGNLIKWYYKNHVDIIVNPLYGAIEIGYAMQSILEAHGITNIKSVFLISYSLYRNMHTHLSENNIPFQLRCRLKNLYNQRILILDDMVNTGKTMKSLYDFFKTYTQTISISAIESNDHYHKIKKSDQYMHPELLSIYPIAQWRYVGDIEEVIKKRIYYFEFKK